MVKASCKPEALGAEGPLAHSIVILENVVGGEELKNQDMRIKV
jgi:hypothetical protein